MSPVMEQIEEMASAEVLAIFNAYVAWLEEMYGLTRDQILWMGYHGNDIFDVELACLGHGAYERSTALFLRNLFYSVCVMDRRAESLDVMRLAGPILDYGCGVGFMAMYLKNAGHDVWAYDVPGVQSDMARAFLVEHGVNWGISEKPGTVFCINVLEHLDDPRHMLDTLRGFGGQLYANCDNHEGVGHIAAPAERQAVIDDLKAKGQFLDFTAGLVDA